MKIPKIDGEAFFNDTDAAVSDSAGNLLFYFNGIDVFNKNHAVIANGAVLNYLTLNNWLYKFDLHSDPIASSKELIAACEPFNAAFPTRFLWSFLAPDNKIYGITTPGLTEIETDGLPPGFYAWIVRANGARIKTGKCIKMQE